MSEPEAEPTPSLIQQRLALQRRRVGAVSQLGFSAVVLAGWIFVLVLDGPNVWRWIGIVVFALGAAIGAVQLRKALRETRAFETRHGPGAGVQKRTE
ncbi:hypothetical protein ASC55_06780 [Microbacterium sp. Root322]|uniref:hypothetical protein n=1 Tax=Microbacterium sp. Root322 TaxID=1736514 RepID=UPI0006F78600|nr:hypothetical protein [Microbacterium sp. Root322]KQV02009.1 hypothetical protein ASC55_06780 [Microbacterium sp. Root322]